MNIFFSHSAANRQICSVLTLFWGMNEDSDSHLIRSFNCRCQHAVTLKCVILQSIKTMKLLHITFGFLPWILLSNLKLV